MTLGTLPGATQEAIDTFQHWEGAPFATRDMQRNEHERGALRDVCIAGIVCGLHVAREQATPPVQENVPPVLSRRDHFALAALQGVLAQSAGAGFKVAASEVPQRVAQAAVIMADALMAELDKENDK